MLSNPSKFYVLFLTFAIVFSCKPKEQAIDEAIPTPVYETEEFLTFYDKFGSDSAFQMDHIVFPLEGIRPMRDSKDTVPSDFKWQRETWTLHKPFDATDENYLRSFKSLSDIIVIENIQNETGEFSMERRFGKLSSGWHLTYYREMGVY